MVLFSPLAEGPLQYVYHSEKRYAGDGFAAGFLVGQMEGWSLAESARLACTVGAFATATAGNVEGYPDMARVRACWAGLAPRER